MEEENIKKVELAIDEAWAKFTQRTFDNTMKGKNSVFEVSEQDWENSSFTIEEFKKEVIKRLAP